MVVGTHSCSILGWLRQLPFADTPLTGAAELGRKLPQTVLACFPLGTRRLGAG